MIFFSLFKTLEGKVVLLELKNSLQIRGTLSSVDQYLNLKLENVEVVDRESFPQLVRLLRPPLVGRCPPRGGVKQPAQPGRALNPPPARPLFPFAPSFPLNRCLCAAVSSATCTSPRTPSTRSCCRTHRGRRRPRPRAERVGSLVRKKPKLFIKSSLLIAKQLNPRSRSCPLALAAAVGNRPCVCAGGPHSAL